MKKVRKINWNRIILVLLLTISIISLLTINLNKYFKPKKETINATANTDTKDAKANTSTSTIDATKSTSTKKVYVDVIKNKTEDKKVCTSGGYTNSYPCNCTGSWSGGQYHTVCSTCTEYIPTESCSTVPGTTTYTCPTGAKKEGSGSSTKCYKNVTTYSCPSGYKEEGSGSSLKCYKNVRRYECYVWKFKFIN